MDELDFIKQIEERTKQIEELGEELQSLQKTNLACMLLHKNALVDFSYEFEGFTLTAGGVSIPIRRAFDIRTNQYSWNEFVYEGIPLTFDQNIAFLELLHKGRLTNQICRLKKQIEQEKKINKSLRKSMQDGEVMAEDIKIGEVFLLPVRVTSRNVNMGCEYLAVEPVSVEFTALVRNPDGTRLLYVKAEQPKKES